MPSGIGIEHVNVPVADRGGVQSEQELSLHDLAESILKVSHALSYNSTETRKENKTFFSCIYLL
jgi:hypothetical protein